jgi:DNA-directed RNA polymerase specialized sigma24 family protein
MFVGLGHMEVANVFGVQVSMVHLRISRNLAEEPKEIIGVFE